jgi:hypothetical protein
MTPKEAMMAKATVANADGIRRGRAYPGLCYPRALRYLLHKLDDECKASAHLVHGIIRTQWLDGDSFTGLPLAHAWVQEGGMVFDGALGRYFDRDVYYRRFQAEAERCYSLSEACALMVEHHSYGPWHETRGVLR